MIKDIVRKANENTLLKRINKRIKTKEKNLKENRKRYWKLSASERLHYDYRIERIHKRNSMAPFFLTFFGILLYFSVLVIFTLFKILFNVDPTQLVIAFLSILGTAPTFFKASIIVDIFLIVLQIWGSRKGIEHLNKNYGFKKV